MQIHQYVIKLLLVILLKFTVSNSQIYGQEYLTSETKWQESSIYWNFENWVHRHYTTTIGADTIVDEYTYKKILSNGVELHISPTTSDTILETSYTYFRGLLREEGDKVYSYKNGDKLLYDFDAEIGDTLFYSNNFRLIDSISSIDVQGYEVKKFHLSGFSFENYFYLERIGFLGGLFSIPAQAIEAGSSLVCYSNHLFLYNPDDSGDCTFEVSATVDQTNNQLSSIKIYPNPFQNTFSIEGSNTQAIKISIYNSYGKLIQEFNNEFTVNVGSLLKGVYFLTIDDGREKIIRKIIKN